MSATTTDLLTLRDFEPAARSVLDPAVYDFYAGGCGDEQTLRDNEAAFARYRLLPRVLRDVARRELAVTLCATPSSMPVFLAPTAFHRLADPDGECATARAAAAAGVIMVVSQAATVPIAAIAAAAPQAQLWFQLYPHPEPEVTDMLVARATAAGATALVVTVDSAVLGRRERDVRNGFLDLPAGYACENMRDLPGAPAGTVAPIPIWPALTWAELDRLRSGTRLPILLKGLLHPADARLAVAHGVDGLLLSNHGGRQLDTVPATLDLLAEIVAAVEGRIPVLLDGGVRRGVDVVKALALGAAAVGIGRPVLWGLAVAGAEGVSRVLRLLREEIDHTLALCGATSVADLNPDLVRAAT